MGFLYLPAQGVLSVSTPPGDLALFASGWRLSIPTGAQHELLFHLQDGNTLRAAINAGAATNELWGNKDAFWFSGASALTLLPPLQPSTSAGGIALPID
jgi:hypothetical protein